MLRKWSVIVSAAVVLGSGGVAGAQDAAGAAPVAVAEVERGFQVNSKEFVPAQATSGARRAMTGQLKVSVNDRPSHTIWLNLEHALSGKTVHRLALEDSTANARVEYAFDAETSVATIRVNNDALRLTHGPNGTYSLEGKTHPNSEAAGKALAEDPRLRSLTPELLGGLVAVLDLVFTAPAGKVQPPRLDEAWQAAVAARR